MIGGGREFNDLMIRRGLMVECLGKEILENSFGDRVVRTKRRAFLMDMWMECVDEKTSSAHCRP
jgi:hypothetical protein